MVAHVWAVKSNTNKKSGESCGVLVVFSRTTRGGELPADGGNDSKSLRKRPQL